jgi:DHA1 family multidrug resistance protein-like MFS transporter
VPTTPNARLSVILLAGAMPAAIGSMFAMRATTGAIQPILPLFVEELADAGTRVASLTGLTFGVSGIGSAVAALALGRAADGLGHRRVLIGSVLAMALLFVPLALVQAGWQLVVCYGLLGTATGGIIPSAHAVVADVTPAARRGVVFGVTSAAASFGGFLGPFGGPLLATTADLRLVFLACGAIMLVAALWLTLALRSVGDAVAASAEPAEIASVPS